MSYLDDLFGLQGKTAVVIGGTGELCGAMALGLAQAGAEVVLAGRDPAKAEDKLGAVVAAGGRGYFAACDVRERASLEGLLEAVLERSGRADILVNGAGVNSPTPFLEVGADDFVLKPFSPRELRARVAALFRRPRTATATDESANGRSPQVPSPAQPVDEPTTISAGAGLVINSARREVQVNGTIVDLTRIEYDVLEYLATHLSRVCTREEMVLSIWSSALTHDHHLVDVHVANLRGKLRRHSDATWIHTIRGIGYRMDREDQPQDRRAGGGPYLVARIDSEDWARGLDF